MSYKIGSLMLSWMIIALAGCSGGNVKPMHKLYIVEIKQMQFQPAELKIERGDTVVWVNHDIVAHDITEEPGKAWASSSLNNGQSWSKVFEESANYFCAIHQVMKGKIVVQ